MIPLDKPVSWKPGIADDAWKIMICAQGAIRTRDLIQGLAYLLDNLGNVSLEQSANVIRRFSGEQIADALLAYYESEFAAVVNGLKKTSEVSNADA